MRRELPSAIVPLCLLPLLFTACGYRVAGRAELLPKNLKTIAVPAFGNVTTRYKLGDLLPAAITREFISRTRYQIVPDPNNADAILSGSVVNFFAYPTTFDPNSTFAAGLAINATTRATSSQSGMFPFGNSLAVSSKTSGRVLRICSHIPPSYMNGPGQIEFTRMPRVAT